jgi:hypothetical protein
MVQNYLETLDWVTNSRLYKRLRYTANTKRLYVDIDWKELSTGDYFVVDCIMGVDPNIHTDTYNEYWLKEYVTTLFKRQWGQNLIKFRGVKLPGGVELNGREIYEDAEKELSDIKQRMSMDYELPPYDFIG